MRSWYDQNWNFTALDGHTYVGLDFRIGSTRKVEELSVGVQRTDEKRVAVSGEARIVQLLLNKVLEQSQSPVNMISTNSKVW